MEKLIKIWENPTIRILGTIIIALVVINYIVPSHVATIQWLDSGKTVIMENSYQLDDYSVGDTVWVSTLWGSPGGAICKEKRAFFRQAVLTRKYGFVSGGIIEEIKLK